MKFKVNILLDNKIIAPEDLHKIVIKSDNIDRIINTVAERKALQQTTESKKAS